MSKAVVELLPKRGFSFDLCRRNEMLLKKGPSSFRRIGFKIVGLIYQEGVILGADTIASAGLIVCEKNCKKIYYMAPNIYCCGSGTAADSEAVTAASTSVSYWSRIKGCSHDSLKSHLLNYQGYVQAALLLGGVDMTGLHLLKIYPHGSTDTLPFATMGPDSLAAMAVFESKYCESLTAICAGIFNDLRSGNNIDVCVITKGHNEYLRNYQVPNQRADISSRGVTFPKKTEVLLTKIISLKEKVVIEDENAIEE